MTGGRHLIEDVRAVLEPHGLFLRGTVNFEPGEAAPLLAGGKIAASILLIGNVGGSMWAAFDAWRQATGETDHPLDRWSKAVIRPVAERSGATAFFPSDPPWQPFQQWAMRAEGLKACPLGMLIHPRYGLWHGYRAALAFGDPLPRTGDQPGGHPCDLCGEKPCLSTCPVDAVTSERFDVPACRGHLATREGRAGCLDGGCLARNACPVGADHRYGPEQLRFHMAALA